MMIYCFSCLKNYNQETKETFSLTKRQIPICRAAETSRPRNFRRAQLYAPFRCIALVGLYMQTSIRLIRRMLVFSRCGINSIHKNPLATAAAIFHVTSPRRGSPSARRDPCKRKTHSRSIRAVERKKLSFHFASCKLRKRKPCLACVFLYCCDRMKAINLN